MLQFFDFFDLVEFPFGQKFYAGFNDFVVVKDVVVDVADMNNLLCTLQIGFARRRQRFFNDSESMLVRFLPGKSVAMMPNSVSLGKFGMKIMLFGETSFKIGPSNHLKKLYFQVWQRACCLDSADKPAQCAGF